ncbi:MAG: hypothetical protein H7A32_02340 [Deltaproteobacteria bacterium]|nr:hypothetical protein [Deltaproteobacteria bacterium]
MKKVFSLGCQNFVGFIVVFLFLFLVSQSSFSYQSPYQRSNSNKSKSYQNYKYRFNKRGGTKQKHCIHRGLSGCSYLKTENNFESRYKNRLRYRKTHPRYRFRRQYKSDRNKQLQNF